MAPPSTREGSFSFYRAIRCAAPNKAKVRFCYQSSASGSDPDDRATSTRSSQATGEEQRWQIRKQRHGGSSANVLTGANCPVRSVGVSITVHGPMVDVGALLKRLPTSPLGAGKTFYGVCTPAY